MQLIPNYTDTSTIASNALITSAGVNSLITPIRTLVNAVDNKTAVRTSTTPYTITANTELVLDVDCSGGNKVVTLPAATGQTNGIYIKKIDSSSNTLTVNVAGSDKIEDPLSPALVPSATSYILRFPDQQVLLFPEGVNWRIRYNYINNRVRVRAYKNASQTVNSGNTDKVLFQAEEYDDYNNFASSTFTVPFAGYYDVSGILDISGSANPVKIYLYKNGSTLRTLFEGQSSASGSDTRIPFTSQGEKLSAGDTLDIYLYVANANRNVNANPDNTFVHYRLISL